MKHRYGANSSFHFPLKKKQGTVKPTVHTAVPHFSDECLSSDRYRVNYTKDQKLNPRQLKFGFRLPDFFMSDIEYNFVIPKICIEW